MVVVFFNRPVDKLAKEVPLIFPTVVAFPVLVTSPVKFALVVTVAALPVIEPAIVELNVCVPVNVCAASVLANVALASGRVNVFSLVVGPLNLVKPFPVPPKADVIMDPFHVPLAMVPTVVNELEPANGDAPTVL